MANMSPAAILNELVSSSVQINNDMDLFQWLTKIERVSGIGADAGIVRVVGAEDGSVVAIPTREIRALSAFTAVHNSNAKLLSCCPREIFGGGGTVRSRSGRQDPNQEPASQGL